MTYYGFNFLWMYYTAPGVSPKPADEKALNFLAKNGFNFARIPTDYRFWTHDFDYFNLDEAVFENFDQYLQALKAHGIHMSLNVHRGPGYCINSNHLEKHNLWQDQIAQDAFVHLWETFARRYKGVPSSELSFDLLNEPPNVGEYGFTREIHAQIMGRTVAAIKAIDPDREIVLNGVGGGHYAMPELAGVGDVHSGRGYQPMPVSHYEASWWSGHVGLPPPVYPDTPWEGKLWNKDTMRELYEGWRDVEAMGTRVHMGEFGCYNHTPNDVALSWFHDLFSIWKEYGWGYGMWNFEGAFGIVNHGRPNARYEIIDGYNVDIDLLNLMKDSRVDSSI